MFRGYNFQIFGDYIYFFLEWYRNSIKAKKREKKEKQGSVRVPCLVGRLAVRVGACFHVDFLASPS
jgi:hypothetical protein